MIRITSFDILKVNLPFRRPFRHAAAERAVSDSVFLKCTTDSGAVGYGESLPRRYVTGETVDSTYTLLRDQILPQLVGKQFETYEQVEAFLSTCDGKAPSDWVAADIPQCAAWCAVDLALLDTFGRAFNRRVGSIEDGGSLSHTRFSGVLSAERGLKLVKLCLLFRAFRFRQVKVKVGRQDCVSAIKMARRFLGRKIDIRADANMAWDLPHALDVMQDMARFGIHSFEQPLRAEALDEMAQIVHETGLDVMADESLNDSDSLRQLIEKKACRAVNVRISKCGGLIASVRRCREARQAGLVVQIGCQVGESSLLSAAQLALLAQVPDVTYVEGCFGRLLLREDVARPILQFGYGGRPPRPTLGPGLGVEVDEATLRRWASDHDHIGTE
jgi:L-Ala-D/L-Glu epimerase